MAMQLRYKDTFTSTRDIVWRIEIWQESPEPFAVGSLSFDLDTSLEIEWPENDKEVPVTGSSATLTILSPGDRTYEDLYTIKAGSIRMDVYRQGQLYWSGCLDPEFYEEPYERAANYPVSLTFTDFGILNRLEYNLTGMRTLREIIDDALSRSGINTGGIAGSRSTVLPGTDGDILDTIAVRSENFTDEEGNNMSLREVLEGILQPLALRMVQRAGHVYIYDLNALYEGARGSMAEIYWSGDSSTMSTDKVANNVHITFSPYAESSMMREEVKYTDDYNKNAVNPWPSQFQDFAGLYSFYRNLSPAVISKPSLMGDATGDELRALNFTIYTSSNGAGLDVNNGRYFHVEPLFNGPSACDGVASLITTGCIPRDGLDNAAGIHYPFGVTGKVYPGVVGEAVAPEHAYTDGDAVLMRLPRMSIPQMESGVSWVRAMLRVKLDMLLDCRYNPLSSEKDDNDSYKEWDEKARFAFVPFSLVLYGRSGKNYVYSNYEIARRPEGQPDLPLSMSLGSWVEKTIIDDRRQYAYLAYYNAESYDNEGGALHGWTTNRQALGRCRDKLSYELKNIADGQYIPYPPEAGELELIIYKGINGYSHGESLKVVEGAGRGMADPKDWSTGKKIYLATWPDWNFSQQEVTVVTKGTGIYAAARWLLFKDLTVEVVENNAGLSEFDADDIEYSGYINRDAKDDLEIDTICGTSDRVLPTARGLYYNADTGAAVRHMSRAGVTDHPEMLLIGTLFSQYATRHTTLSGEVSMSTVSGPLGCFSEVNQGDKVFMLKGEVQKVAEDISDATFVELSPDKYKSAEL